MTSTDTYEFHGTAYSTNGCPTHDEQGRLARYRDSEAFRALPNAEALRIIKVQEEWTERKVDGLSRQMIQDALAEWVDEFAEDDTDGYDNAGALVFSFTDYGLARLAHELRESGVEFEDYDGWMSDDSIVGQDIAQAFLATHARCNGYVVV